MTDMSPPTTPVPLPLHRRIHRAGLVTLIVGLLSSVAIYLFAAWQGAQAGADSAPDLASDRGYNFAMERIGGKSAVFAAAFNRWLGSLWHGTTLAFTVASLSVLVALLCFWLARFMSFPLPADEAPAVSPQDASPTP